MFEKLKRAKSFVVRTKTREDLDLSESSHLRRNVVINNAAINRQRQLTGGYRAARQQPQKGKLNRQMSASHETIYDDREILEQLRRINFGNATGSARKEVVECYNKNNSSEVRSSGEKSRDRDGRALKTSEQRPRMERVVKK